MKDIKFLWRENYIDYLWATETTGKHYFIDSGYFIYRNGVLSAYATKNEISKSKELTKHLIDNPAKILEIKKHFDDIKEVIDIYHNLFISLKLEKLSNEDLFGIYVSLIDLYSKFIDSYKFTEPHMIDHVESNIKKIVTKLKGKKDSNKIISHILSDKKYIKKYDLENYTDIFNLVKNVAEVRFEAKKITNELSEDTENVLIETARRTNYAVNQISAMSLRELKRLLLKSSEIDLYILNQRSKSFGIKVKVKNNKTFVEDLTDKQVKTIEALDVENTGLLRGDSVYPGIIKGNVRLVPKLFSQKDYIKYVLTLKKGDIIVAPMTSPSLTPGFSKVSGVITDEGGLMSHAALVSREKKIPCVVGTKNATQILKEGDIIELNADEGVITIK